MDEKEWWYVVANNGEIIGPFPTYQRAVDWMADNEVGGTIVQGKPARKSKGKP